MAWLASDSVIVSPVSPARRLCGAFFGTNEPVSSRSRRTEGRPKGRWHESQMGAEGYMICHSHWG